MQATVASYDPETASGTVFLDDGVEVSFAGDALRGSRLRLLRLQRSRLQFPGGFFFVEKVWLRVL